MSGGRTLADAIRSHDNHFTTLRLLLAASVIYFHSFGMTQARGYVDHLTSVIYPLTTVGGLAVQAFFFLSGLFVAQSFSRDPRVTAFALKRALRIWPGFFVCLVVTVLLAIATTPSARWSDYLVHDGSYRYILQNSYFNLTWHIQGLWADHPLTALNGPIHTLPLESKMYAVLAIVAGLGMLASRKRIVLGCMVLLAVVFMPAPMANTVSRFFTADYGRAAGAMFIAGVAVYGLAGVLRLHLWQGLRV